MSNLSTIMRSYSGKPDLQIIVDLFDACEAVDRLELSISIAQLQTELAAPEIDRVMLWEDAQGQLIGFGELSIAEPIEDNLADGRLWMKNIEINITQELLLLIAEIDELKGKWTELNHYVNQDIVRTVARLFGI
jgi:hypothetical protein